MEIIHQRFFPTMSKLIAYKIVKPKLFIPKINFQRILPHSFSSSAFKCSNDDSSKYLQDQELQDMIKEMYKDFGVKKKIDVEDVEKLLAGEEYEIEIDQSITDKKPDKEKWNFSTHDIVSNKHEFSTDIIYDYDEEMLLRKEGLWEETKRKKEKDNKVYVRGKMGVFDVEELVEFLRDQKTLDVVVIQVPPEIQYVDYLVIATGKSNRHSHAVAEFFNKVYKKKKNIQDNFIVIEGKGSPWLAIDMGNIALHIMSEEIREEKDLESLWTVGPAFDEKCSWKLEDSSYSYLSLSDQLHKDAMKEDLVT